MQNVGKDGAIMLTLHILKSQTILLKMLPLALTINVLLPRN